MKRLRTVLAFVLLCLCAAAEAQHGAPQSPSSQRPNILILLADDLGIDQIGAYGVGADLPKTPHIDALASGGVLFRRAWAHPVCSPSRAAIQTGRYAFRTGIGTLISPDSESLSLQEMTLPELLKQGGAGAYRCGAFGKWHLSNDPSNPNLAGYDHYAGSPENLYCGLSSCDPPDWQGPVPYDYFHWPKIVNGVETIVDGYATSDTVDSALSWIAQTPEPWLGYVAFHAPHSPFQAPPAELSDSGLAPGSMPGPNENLRPYYKAMVEALDSEIGRLLCDMDPQVLQRTTVLFLSDNGTPQQVVAPPLNSGHAKGTLYEGGINVPLIVSGAKVSGRGECYALVNSTDLFATIADLTGMSLGPMLANGIQLDSVSFAPHLSNPQLRSIRRSIFSEFFAPIVAMPHCEESVGLAGPGEISFTVCGDALFAGNESLVTISGAPAHSLVSILGSTALDPIPLFQGMLGPWPVLGQWSFFADERGMVQFPLPGGTASGLGFEAYFQAIAQDPQQNQGYAFSNTVRIEWPNEASHFRVVAIRNQRFKIVRVLHLNYFLAGVYPQDELFLDLQNDPGELDNLLLHAQLSPLESSSYTKLTAMLDDLLASE